MLPERLPRAGRLETLRIGIADRLTEKREVVRRFDVVRQRLDRPETDITVTVRLLVRMERTVHEPLRPCAVRILLGEDGREDPANSRELAGRQQPFDRSLADVAHTPRR